MDSCIVLVMLIISYVYPIQVRGGNFQHNKLKKLIVSTYNKTYLVDLEDYEKSDRNVGAGSDANDYGQDYQNGSCSGNLEFGWAYPSKKDKLNRGATDKKKSPQECQAHCKKTQRCVGFTWVDFLNNCWLKHNMSAHFKDYRGPGFISGRKDTCIGPAPWPIYSCGNTKQCEGDPETKTQLPDPLGIRTSKGDLCTYTNTVSLSPIPKYGDVRLVMTWGQSKRDLNLHVIQTKANDIKLYCTARFHFRLNCSGLTLDTNTENRVKTITFYKASQKNSFIYTVYVENRDGWPYLDASNVQLTIQHLNKNMIVTMDKTNYTNEKYWLAGCIRFTGYTFEWKFKNVFYKNSPFFSAPILCLCEFGISHGGLRKIVENFN